jgi:hypothetical protein
MALGFASVRVFFSPMPTLNYRVTATITSIGPIAGPSGTCEQAIDGCVNIQVSSKTLISFLITMRSTETGALSFAPRDISFDWIAIPEQGQTGQQSEDPGP